MVQIVKFLFPLKSTHMSNLGLNLAIRLTIFPYVQPTTRAVTLLCKSHAVLLIKTQLGFNFQLLDDDVKVKNA